MKPSFGEPSNKFQNAKTKRGGFLKMEELIDTNLNLDYFIDKPLTFVGQIMSWQLCSFYLGWNLQDRIYVD